MADTFERTQLWKEYSHPIILRQSAVKAATEFCSMNNMQPSIKELLALTKHFLNYFETGDESWISKTDAYLSAKTKNPQ